MIKAVLIFVLSFYSFKLLSQTFHTGQFSIPRIVPGYDFFEHSDYHPLRGLIMHLVLLDNKYAVVIKDSRGDIQTRSVYDFDANKFYTVGKLEEEWIYFKDTIAPYASFYQIQNSVLNLFYRGLVLAPEKVNYKGFSCYSIQMFSKEYGKVSLLATDQIILPSKSNFPNHKPSLLDSVVILKALFENEEVRVDASMDTFYSNIQNPEWLVPTQEGAITYIEKQKHEVKQILQTTYAAQANKGENLDIGIALYDFGLLSESDIKSRIEGNDNVDKLFWMNQTEAKSRSITYDSLIKVWIKTGLISQTLKQKIEKYKMKNWKGARDSFFSMMSLLMLHEMLSDRKNRETIITNMSLNRYQFKPGSEKLKTDFLNGNADISYLFLAVDGMYPIQPFYKTKDKSRIENEVRNLLVLIFPNLAQELNVWISLDSKNSKLHVTTKKFQYQVEIFRDHEAGDEENKNLKGLKEFNFNAEFLTDFEPVLKQIGTDYQNNKIFGFRSFAENINNVESWTYEQLTQNHTELSLFRNLWYAGALDRSLANWSADIKISYINTDLAYYQSDFSSLYLCSSFVEYLPSEKKKNVIEFIRRHQQDLNLSDEAINATATSLQYELIELDEDIAEFIPHIQYTVSRLSEEEEHQNPMNIYFSDYFPHVYEFIRQDFNPILIGFSDDSSELYWKDDTGQLDTIPMSFHSTEESILAFLHKKLKPTGYGIYTLPSMRLTVKQYYYLTQPQKKELETILNARLIEIR